MVSELLQDTNVFFFVLAIFRCFVVGVRYYNCVGHLFVAKDKKEYGLVRLQPLSYCLHYGVMI